MRTLLIIVPIYCTAATAADESWKLPLARKAASLEQNIVERHNILGLYPSQVEVPLDGRPVDQTTLGISNVVHSVCWTANYLAGASYRYAFLKKTGASEPRVAQARARADELFEAVYRCQLVTGVRGLQARGYLLGHGESYAERWGGDRGEDWHQGAGEYHDLRWRGEPSHHNYSDAIHGLGQYYDLAAEGAQKDRCREAIDALVSWWVDHDLMIHGLDRSRRPVPILGITDGKTLNTRVMMAIAGAKVAHHATGKAKFKQAYDRLVTQYGVRGLTTFRAGKDFDDAEHVFCHLENLFRIEDDSALRAGYRVVLNALWAQHTDDAQSLFTYIHMSLTPDAPDRDKALTEALYSLQTWPTDMTLRPRMNSVRSDLKPPYPVYAAAWDNEYIWKGNLLRADGWLSRTVTDVAVSAEDPLVIYAIDEAGDLYQSRDGARTAGGWRPIDQALRSPVRAIDVGHKTRIVFAACDDGFYITTTAGYTWERMPVPADGERPVDVLADPNHPFVVYAMTDKGAYRAMDYGEEFLGQRWAPLTGDLPQIAGGSYAVAPGDPGRVYAVLDGVLFTRPLDSAPWERRTRVGLRSYAQTYPWFVVDASNPDRAVAGVKTSAGGFGTRSFLQQTTDAGQTWSNDRNAIFKRLADGGFRALLSTMIQGEITKPAIDPKDANIMYIATERGVLKSVDGGKTWQEKNRGLDIPVARAVFVPPNTDWIFAATPAGLYLSKDAGETWEDAHLVLQFQKNTRREIGGAAYIDAYWRARYYGFIDDAVADTPFEG